MSINKELYTKILDSVPIITVDIVIFNPEKDKVLLFKRENKPLQIILFPEGNIYNKNLSNYNNLLNPTNGIFELLRYKLSEIENVYDFTILYKIKNKRLIGEYEIITNLSNDDLEISVEMEKYNISQIDEKWIFNVWDKKDKVIERHL